MKLTQEDLLNFQVKNAVDIVKMMNQYPSDRFRAVYNRFTAKMEPFVCRLKAITGAGKTPILADTLNYVKDGIILWTTSLGAVISQTYVNLSSGGKYNDLLPNGTKVYMLSDMSPTDWHNTMNEKSGITILLATVASFNQDGDTLKIHQKGRYGNLSRWEMLSRFCDGEESRHRNLYIYYDEGHGATSEQFRRLADLNPKSFLLASASPFPSDLTYLLYGETLDEKEEELKKRTVLTDTKKVVSAGLLKNRIYFSECQTTDDKTLEEANSKYNQLSKELKQHKLIPIMCAIVNDTNRGIDVWEELVKLGVPKNKIAVHLNNAKEIAYERYGSYNGIVDTYTGKKPKDRAPQKLKENGYTHIIWNLTLREGWDEPLAYVAYVDDYGKSETDMVQKIGRFIRQPNGKPFNNPDLNSAYFYFNVKDKTFINLLKRTQEELEVDGYEVITLPSGFITPPSYEVPPRIPIDIPCIALQRGKPQENDKIILKYIKLLADSERKTEGRITTRVYDVSKGENEQLMHYEVRESSGNTTVWDYVSTRLQRLDSRIVNSTGNIFTNELRQTPQMKQVIEWGSPAMEAIDVALDNIKEELEEQIELVNLKGIKTYTVPSFMLVNPNIKGVSSLKEEKYKVRKFNNSVHKEYNGLNPFEVSVAETLDTLGDTWARNPSTTNGYGIPIPIYGVDNANFKPDFILWSKKNIWAIDPKGKHLLDTAVTTKMLDLDSIGIRIAFVLEGSYEKSGNTFTKKSRIGGYTLVRKNLGGIAVKYFTSLELLVKYFD